MSDVLVSGWFALAVYIAGVAVAFPPLYRRVYRDLRGIGSSWDGTDDFATAFMALVLALIWPGVVVFGFAYIAARPLLEGMQSDEDRRSGLIKKTGGLR